MIVDLHSHTTASDGALSPSELIDRAIQQRISMLAITDHDTIEGYRKAKSYVRANDLPLQVISGVELSTRWKNLEIHVVGLEFQAEHSSLSTLLSSQQAARRERAAIISEKLDKAGVSGCLEAASELAGEGEITRAHFARVLVAKGVVSSMEQAFKKYLRRGKRAYAEPTWVLLADAVQHIHDADGVAVLAHPSKYDLSWKMVETLVEAFSAAGGDAIEVAMCHQFPNERQKLAELANRFSLAASQGSDFHRPNSWIELGKNLWLPSGASPIWEKWQAA